MNPADFLNRLAKSASSFQRMIESGAQWEVPAHVEITGIFREMTNKIPVREFRYASVLGASAGNDSLDLLVQDGSELYAIELKVESATNRGQFAGLSAGKVTELDIGVNSDANKLSKLTADKFTVSAGEGDTRVTFTPSAVHRWILVIAWSPGSVSALKARTGDAIFTDQGSGIVFWLASF